MKFSKDTNPITRNRALFWLLSSLMLFAFAPTPEVSAQAETRGAAMMSTGGGGPAFVRDNGALFFNPANLVYSDRGSRVVLTLGNVAAFSGGDLYQFNYYNDSFASGRTLSESDIAGVLDAWFGTAEANELRDAGFVAEVVPLALTFRAGEQAFGLGIRARAYSSAGFNRGLLDLILGGTLTDRDVAVDGTFQSMTTTEVTVAYNRRFNRLSVGIAPKVVFGTSYSKGTFTSNAAIRASEITQTFDYTIEAAGSFSRDFVNGFSVFKSDPFQDVSFTNPFASVAGRGFGLDLGITYQLRPQVQVAFSLTNLGSIAWDGDAQTVTPLQNTFHFEGLSLDKERIDNEFDGKLGRYAESVLDSLARGAYQAVNRSSEGFSTNLPTAVHIGTAWRSGRAALNAGLSMAMNNAPGNLSQAPSYYVGGEYRLGPFPIRSGVRFGGEGAMTVGFGLGLRTRVYDFNIGVSASPQSDMLGAGGRYAIALSLVNIHI